MYVYCVVAINCYVIIVHILFCGGEGQVFNAQNATPVTALLASLKHAYFAPDCMVECNAIDFSQVTVSIKV